MQQEFGSWLIDVTYAANKGNSFAANSYNLNQVDPAVRLQLGQGLNTAVPNPYAGLVPGGLGAATITRERSLMAFPYYNAVNVRNPRMGNYLSHQLTGERPKAPPQWAAARFCLYQWQKDQ